MVAKKNKLRSSERKESEVHQDADVSTDIMIILQTCYFSDAWKYNRDHNL